MNIGFSCGAGWMIEVSMVSNGNRASMQGSVAVMTSSGVSRSSKLRTG
jgi:hypothetical protein